VTTLSPVGKPDVPYGWYADVIHELKRIHPAETSALVLSYFHGLSHPKIADELGLSTTEVHRLVAHGLAQLGAALAAGDPEAGQLDLASTA
jgi:DNA-directed RNA polymerase specialized sigma24 family protein